MIQAGLARGGGWARLTPTVGQLWNKASPSICCLLIKLAAQRLAGADQGSAAKKHAPLCPWRLSSRPLGAHPALEEAKLVNPHNADRDMRR